MTIRTPADLERASQEARTQDRDRLIGKVAHVALLVGLAGLYFYWRAMS